MPAPPSPSAASGQLPYPDKPEVAGPRDLTSGVVEDLGTVALDGAVNPDSYNSMTLTTCGSVVRGCAVSPEYLAPFLQDEMHRDTGRLAKVFSLLFS